jgi:hypothetical protein
LPRVEDRALAHRPSVVVMIQLAPERERLDEWRVK